MAPVVADWTVNMTGMVSPMRAVGGFRATEAPTAKIVAKVALLERMVSVGLFRNDARLTTVLTPAGMVMAVERGTIEAVEVGVDVLEPPMTVTKTSTV